ncbi:MAG: hypothetical protein K2Q25_12235 [Mycobacteriaceae bacterium]|nr:hypothetical protein [Mycobacteriaceae bacterium]
MARREESSAGLFDPVARMLRLPFGTPEFIDRIVTGGINQAGRRTLQMLIITWDAAGGGPFAASAIASTGLAKTIDTVQGMFIGPVFDPVLKLLGADKIRLRASLCASQLVGVGIMRYAVRTEPLYTMDVDALVNAIGPTLQRYLVGDIS